MKALKIITIIMFCVLVCGIVSVTLVPWALSECGFAYRKWLIVTLCWVTILSGSVFGISIWSFLVKKHFKFTGIVATIITPMFLIVLWLTLSFYALIYNSDRMEVIDDVKYVVVDESFMMRFAESRYLYVNAFVRGREVISSISFKT